MDLCNQCLSLKFGHVPNNLPHELFTSFRALEESATQTKCPLCQFIAYEFKYPSVTVSGHRSSSPASTEELRSSPVTITDSGPADRWFLVNCSNSYFQISCSLIPQALQLYTNKYHDPSDTHTGSQRSLSLAKYWLQTCVEDHHDCSVYCGTCPTLLPTRVLYLGSIAADEDPVLQISNGLMAPYVALSYCWGKKPFIKTCRTNFGQMQQGIPIQLLPKTFLDAIAVTKALGCDYLWIDALCIIQDDPEDWQRESIKMRDVYKNALVTICAQDSPNPFGGCFSRRDPLIRRPIVLPLYNEEGLLDGELFWSRDVGVPSGSPGPLGPLDYRAWTLQEQVLSGRVLAYCEGTVFWFCSTTALWEAKPIWEKDIQRLSDYAKLKRLVINYDAWPVSRMLRSAKKTRRAAYDAWYDLVGKYSGRNITKPKDRMVAISAVAEAMSLILDDQYVAGLWKRDIIRGLLWMSVRGRNVRPRRAKRGQGYVAPSWSWASINHGAVLALFSMKLNCGILTYGSQIITPEFRFRRYEYMEELPVKAPSDPEILTVQCSNIGTSPFGQVKSGTIRLKGYTREVVLRPRGKNLYDRALHTKIGKAHIDEFRLLSSRKLVVTCLFMARYVKEDEEAFLSSSKDIQQFGKCICLGLVPTRLRKNEYRRIGLAEIDYWKWDMEEKREIFLV